MGSVFVRVFALGVSAIAISTSPVQAYVFRGTPECPWSKPENKWSKYINRDYGPSYFSIQFNRDVGSMASGQCYTLTYLGNQLWSTAGTDRGTKPPRATVEQSRGGDPLQYQINAWGQRLTYNEAGEVFWEKDNKLAGQMYCHIGNECWK